MAVRTERNLVAGCAGLVLLRGIEFMAGVEISGMVLRCALVVMAIRAQLGFLHLYGVLFYEARGLCAGEQQDRRNPYNKENGEHPGKYSLHGLFPPFDAGCSIEVIRELDHPPDILVKVRVPGVLDISAQARLRGEGISAG